MCESTRQAGPSTKYDDAFIYTRIYRPCVYVGKSNCFGEFEWSAINLHARKYTQQYVTAYPYILYIYGLSISAFLSSCVIYEYVIKMDYTYKL